VGVELVEKDQRLPRFLTQSALIVCDGVVSVAY
jgi:hypothetical protein